VSSDIGRFGGQGAGEHSSPCPIHIPTQSEVCISMLNCYLCKAKQLLVYHKSITFYESSQISRSKCFMRLWNDS